MITTEEEIKLIQQLEELECQASLRANDLLREESRRNFSRATADAYAFCIMRIRQVSQWDDKTRKVKHANEQTTD